MEKKSFSQMTQSEINALTKEEFRSISPFEKRSCYDCGNLRQALNWWCGSPEAVKARGTRIPGCIKCTYWVPDWSNIDDKYKTPENGFKVKKESIKEIHNEKKTPLMDKILGYFKGKNA